MIMQASVMSFFFNDTATTEIYTLSLHDALPILSVGPLGCEHAIEQRPEQHRRIRSEEHTSELQSPCKIVCRLLLEKKKNKQLKQTTLKKQTADMGYNLLV